MRRSTVFLAPLSLCLLAVFACEDDSDIGSGTFNLDAGNLDVLVPPSPTSDASTDAGTDSAPAPLGVNVAVIGSATARANVEVVFQYADGTLETTHTGVDGTATSAGATTPAMATALLGGGARFTPFTWIGVVAGDVLSVPAIEDTSAIGRFNVATAPKSNASVNSLRIEATSVCGTTRTTPIGAAFVPPYAVDVSAQCIPASGKAALLAKESAGSTVTAFAFAKALDVPAATGTATTLGAWTTPTTLTLGITKPDPNNPFVSTQIAELYEGATFDVQNGLLFTSQQATETFNVAAGFASAYQAAITVTNGSSVQQQMLQQATTAFSFDLSAVLPVLSNATVTGDALAPDFGWDGDTSTTTIGGAVQFSYAGTQDAAYLWTIFVPPGTKTVHLPKLPADASDFAPMSTTTLASYGRPEVVFVQASGLSAATLRGKLSAFPDLTTNGLLNATRCAPLPAPGLYRVTALEQQQL